MNFAHLTSFQARFENAGHSVTVVRPLFAAKNENTI